MNFSGHWCQGEEDPRRSHPVRDLFVKELAKLGYELEINRKIKKLS